MGMNGIPLRAVFAVIGGLTVVNTEKDNIVGVVRVRIGNCGLENEVSESRSYLKNIIQEVCIRVLIGIGVGRVKRTFVLGTLLAV